VALRGSSPAAVPAGTLISATITTSPSYTDSGSSSEKANACILAWGYWTFSSAQPGGGWTSSTVGIRYSKVGRSLLTCQPESIVTSAAMRTVEPAS
jgi:hypothetical protein